METINFTPDKPRRLLIHKAYKFWKDNQYLTPADLQTETSLLDHKAARKLFFDTLHAGNTGFIFLPRKKRWDDPEQAFYTDDSGKRRRKNPFKNDIYYELGSERDPDELIWADTNDCYISANPMDGEPDKDGRRTRDEQHCIGINEMHLDIDVLHALMPYDQVLADKVIGFVIAKLKAILPQPTMIVSSGRGLTWIYRYNKLIQNPTQIEISGKRKIVTFLNPEVHKHDQAFNACIQKVQALFDPEIIDVDSRITDHARILRMPGTINRKAGRYAVLVECNPECRYDPETLYELLGVTESVQHDNARKDCADATKPSKRKKSARKGKNRKSVSHAGSALDNVILFAPLRLRWAAKSRIPKMEEVAAKAEMRDGMGRKKFLFAYYCHTRLLYTRDTAYEMSRTLNESFAEPLDEIEFEEQLRRVDEHEERPEWDMHSDGTYIFRAETLEDKFLPPCAAGVFTADAEKRKEYAKNQKEAAERDHRIAELWLSGMSVREISKVLDKKFQHVSQDTVKRVVKRLGLTRKRTEKVEDIDFTLNKRYRRRVVAGQHHKSAGICEDGATLHESRGDERCREESQIVALEKIVSGENTFLTGAAGTGKTHTLLKAIELLRLNGKIVKVLAPSGVAAECLSGDTINSGLHIVVEPSYVSDSVSAASVRDLEKVDVLVIDEISMVRADLFGKVIAVKREAEHLYHKKIQMIVCGDFHQIAPVVKDSERPLMKRYEQEYGSVYAFSHPFGWEESIWQNRIELQHVWRQDDTEYCQALDRLAMGDVVALSYFNRHVAVVDSESLLRRIDEGELYLGAFRREVDQINRQIVQRHIHDKSYITWSCTSLVGNPDADFSVEKEIPLYEGMPVLFVKNTERYKNGSRGIVRKICKKCVIVDVGGEMVRVYPVKMYAQDDHCSLIKQLPIRPCYALTVHKAQGLTLDKVILDPCSFEAGQLYTALSRVKNAKSLTFTRPIRKNDVIANSNVLKFLALKQVAG